MAHMVLGIGYSRDEHVALRREWREHDVDFQFVDTTEEAVNLLRQRDYVCITICTSQLDNGQLEALRSIGPVPIVVLSPKHSVAQRANVFQQGAAEFILRAHQWQKAEQSGKDAVQFYLDFPDKGEEPLTIVTTDELYFCLEYRTVEVRNQRIELTPKEFDILALLITHPRRVFTFEMTLALVWGEEYTDASRQVLWNHVSHLRQKMKVAPDVPDYIKSIHGVGYKYEPI